MAHDQEGDYPHRYFKSQPDTPEEVERAVMACSVSCVRAVRYAGRNPTILDRFRGLGSGDSCDVLSPEEAKGLSLALRQMLEGLRRAENEPNRSPSARPDHPLYDQELDG